MKRQIVVPELGEQISGGTVLSVLVSAGDEVTPDQAIVELETDKATVEVPAGEAGTVREVLVAQGDELQVGAPILDLDDGSERRATETAERGNGGGNGEEERGEAGTAERAGERGNGGGDGEEEPEAAETPGRGNGGNGGEKSRRRGKGHADRAPTRATPDREGKRRAERSTAAEREQRPERTTAVDREERAKPSTEVVSDRDRPTRPARPTAPPRAEPRPAHARRRPPPQQGIQAGLAAGIAPAATPWVRSLARDLGVEIDDVPLAGAATEVTEEDVHSYVRELVGEAQQARLRRRGRPELPDFERWGEIDVVPMDAVRRTVSRSVSRSWEQVPAVTQWDRADITDLEASRKRDGAPSLTAIVVKAVAAAVRAFADLNASVDPDRLEIVRKRYVHVGVAVDTEHGLMMPVLRDVADKSITEIGAELRAAADAARARRLAPEDLEGASVAVTNLGGLGTTQFTPIVPWPQAVIVSVGRAEPTPVYRDGELCRRIMLPLGLTYDHRAVDGATAARALRWIALGLGDPLRLLMDPAP